MSTTISSLPLVDMVDRISALQEPVNRNLQITNCYGELSKAFEKRTGIAANWCTFATWASKQAGVTIRGEDLKRIIEDTLRRDPSIVAILELIKLQGLKLGGEESGGRSDKQALSKLVEDATARASAAVAKGNLKVFQEIGKEFARFISTCLQDEVYNENTIDAFCKKLKPGPPPEGQEYLCKAFSRYYKAFFESNNKRADELRYMANLEIGFHEQVRLQPEILESMNAGLVDSQHVRDYVTDVLVKSKSWWGKILYFFSWLTGKTGLLKKSIDKLVDTAGTHIRRIITEHLMTITIPPDISLRLGHDLQANFPPDLQQLEDPELVALLKQLDPTVNTTDGDAATDWSVLNQRLHFISDLFRCYHKSKDLFSDAFSKEQVEILNAGGVPDGRL